MVLVTLWGVLKGLKIGISKEAKQISSHAHQTLSCVLLGALYRICEEHPYP